LTSGSQRCAELCLDKYAPSYLLNSRFRDRAVVDPVVAAKPGDTRVARGGSWKSSGAECRSAARKTSSGSSDTTGFRVVVEAQ
jgi:formylglycine-generating enzyme required for sulfatase activity